MDGHADQASCSSEGKVHGSRRQVLDQDSVADSSSARRSLVSERDDVRIFSSPHGAVRDLMFHNSVGVRGQPPCCSLSWLDALQTIA